MRLIYLCLCLFILISPITTYKAEAKNKCSKHLFRSKKRICKSGGRGSFRSKEQHVINAVQPTGQTRAASEHAANDLYAVSKGNTGQGRGHGHGRGHHKK